jgi:hypothetical protein
MNAQKLDRPGLLDVSPMLEMGSPTPLSTYWMPLDELIAHWTQLVPLLTPDPDASLLAAIGHALLALSQETSALRLYTQAWQQQHGQAASRQDQGRQAVRHLYEAGDQWCHAGAALDTLLTTELEPPVGERAGRLMRVACTQQERLWWLAHEVGDDVGTWCSRPGQGREAEA